MSDSRLEGFAWQRGVWERGVAAGTMASSGGKSALRAEMGAFLGLGPSTVLIDADVFQKKANRVELTMTAAEVRERISKQNQKPH